MAEDTWLKIEREYFVEANSSDLGVLPKTANKVIEAYNRFLQKALLGDSPFIAEDLRRTIIKSNEEVKEPDCCCEKRTPDGIIIGGFCLTEEDQRKSRGTFQRCTNCGGRIYTA
jgi:hypothetical protein